MHAICSLYKLLFTILEIRITPNQERSFQSPLIAYKGGRMNVQLIVLLIIRTLFHLNPTVAKLIFASVGRAGNGCVFN